MIESGQQRLIKLQNELLQLKTSQIIGGDNNMSFSYSNSISSSIPGGAYHYRAYYIAFLGTQPFPLVGLNFKIYENGVLKKEPRGPFDYNISGQRDTILQYELDTVVNRWTPTIFNSDFDSPNFVLYQLLVSGQTGVSYNIEVEMKTSCPGVARFQLAYEG